MALRRGLDPILLSIVFLALGCATSGGVAPNRNEISKLKGSAEIRAITYAPAPFVLMSAGKVAAGSMFGIIGGAVAGNSMAKAGQEMIATHGVTDPAIDVRERLARTLESDFGLQATVDTAPATDSVPELKARFRDGAVLDTRTMGWQLVYYPADWSHHYLIYGGRARLLRLSDGKVLWEGKCFRKLPDAKGSRRTVDEYRANNGELLKQKVGEATSGCAEELTQSEPLQLRAMPQFVRPADGPIAFTIVPPTGLTNVQLTYTTTMPGFILEEGTSNALTYFYDAQRLARDFPNLDLHDPDGHAGVDTITMSFLVSGTDASGVRKYFARQIVLQGEELQMPEQKPLPPQPKRRAVGR